MRTAKLLVALCAAATIATAANAQGVDWQKVDAALGRTAAVGGDVHRYGFPRSDLKVTVDGVTIMPALALGGWAAFKPMGNMAMVMGDVVLLGSEINPVISKLIEGGLEVSAIHNHLLRAEPMTFYLHIAGHGDPVKMATALHAALGVSKTPLTAPAAAGTPPAIDLDTAQLDQIIGVKGTPNGGVYGFGVPRRDPVTENGMQIAPAGPMGVATGINFQPTGGGKAAITGDFVLIGSEVNPVVNALRANGIEVTAIHSHMLDEQPRLIFMHFWANDDALKLAKGVRAALDKTASVKNWGYRPPESVGLPWATRHSEHQLNGVSAMRRPLAAIAVIVGVLTFGPPVVAAEKFQRLSGPQIRAKLAGMEITDEAHWADVFAANGTLTSYSTGRKNTGKWNVQKDALCIDRGNDDGGCYQVWLSGKKVELRREGSGLPLEGVLQKQSVRR